MLDLGERLLGRDGRVLEFLPARIRRGNAGPAAAARAGMTPPAMDAVIVPDFTAETPAVFEARTLFFLASWLEVFGEGGAGCDDSAPGLHRRAAGKRAAAGGARGGGGFGARAGGGVVGRICQQAARPGSAGVGRAVAVARRRRARVGRIWMDWRKSGRTSRRRRRASRRCRWTCGG